MATAGLGHVEKTPAMPCQDAADGVATPRPALVLADGAGSSPASDLGARTLVSAMLRLADTLEAQLAWLLDGREAPTADAVAQLAELLVRHAKGTLHDRAGEQCRPVRDLRCTLLLALVGCERVLWLKVGDGELVLERAVPVNAAQETQEASEAQNEEAPELMPNLRTLGERGKGEFANQTLFVDERLAFEQVQYGVETTAALTGIALMSDGAAEKLVAYDGEQVSGQLSHWLDDLRQGKLRQRDLIRRFYSETFCRGTSGDDRSIALAARDLP
ncbi:protein phosphatase 2C domain-containing protein [Halomonas desiderata]|uniref:protein phosphatase 2C domain-containing protein n=1 Tax=Billgrantia desiderata TaxID=52021 RepID=UPI001748AC9E|nr:protein phosphatase 2C domain-containing protein [Halomonas desiderata]